MKSNSTWYANSQRIRILMMSVISGHDTDIFLGLGICFATEIQLPLIYKEATYREKIGQLEKINSSNVIVLFCTSPVITPAITTMKNVITYFDKILLIGSETMGKFWILDKIFKLKPGFVYTRVMSNIIPDFNYYIESLSVDKMRTSPWFKTSYEQFKNCTFENGVKNKQKCSSSESVGNVLSHGSSYYVSDKVLDAVYVFAHALHQVLKRTCQNISNCEQNTKISGPMLLDAIRNSSFPSVDGRKVYIDDKGEVAGGYTFYYVIPGDKKGTRQNVNIGSWQGQLKMNSTLVFDSNLISVNAHCSEPCKNNEIKRLIYEKPLCCWTCVECSDGSIAINETTCYVCKRGYFANKQRKRCVKIPEVFYSLDKRISKLLVIPPLVLAVVGMLGVLVTLSIFIKYHSNPLIKASGRELCCILLTGLFLSFLFPFVSICRPSLLKCLSQFILDSLPLTISLVPIAMKTNRVVRIFDPTRKITDRPIFTRSLPQLLISILLVSIQIILLFTVIMLQLPREKIVYFSSTEVHLVCGVTQIQIFLAHLYNFILIMICTYYGFRARKIPSNFNEAKSIAFSMYATSVMIIVFFVVFVVLANASSNEILQQAIQSYCVVLLGNVILFCFFAPKIYNVIFQRKSIKAYPDTTAICNTQKGQVQER